MVFPGQLGLMRSSLCFCICLLYLGFPGSSAGKESTCNAEDPGSVPGLGRSTGKGIDYPLQYSWASLMAQLVKNTPAMQETWVWTVGWEDPLEKGKAVVVNKIPQEFICQALCYSALRLFLKLTFKQWFLLVSWSYQGAVCVSAFVFCN